MRAKVLSTIFLVVIGLAVIGLVINLVVNPINLLKTLLIGLGIAFLLFLALQFFKNGKNHRSSPEMKKYNAAVKQSKHKNSKQTSESTNRANFRVTKKTTRNKRPSHLRVIEGKKTKDKQ